LVPNCKHARGDDVPLASRGVAVLIFTNSSFPVACKNAYAPDRAIGRPNASRREAGRWGAQCPVFHSGRPAPRPRRYGGVSGNENPPACNACRWCSLTVSEAVAARQQASFP